MYSGISISNNRRMSESAIQQHPVLFQPIQPAAWNQTLIWGARGGYPTTKPYWTQNVLATLYRVLVIDPATTLPDHNGRPRYLLDDRRLVKELV